MSRSGLSLLSTEHKNYSVASSTYTIFCVAMLYTISPRNICKHLISGCYPRSLRRGTNENGKKVEVSLSPHSRLGATAVSRWHSVRDVCYEQLHASQWWEQGALETKRSINAALWIKKKKRPLSLALSLHPYYAEACRCWNRPHGPCVTAVWWTVGRGRGCEGWGGRGGVGTSRLALRDSRGLERSGAVYAEYQPR